MKMSAAPPLCTSCTVYGDPRYERLAGLSVSHL